MPQEHDKIFAELLKKRLKNANLNREQLAGIMEIDRSNVYRWLDGESTPRRSNKTRRGLLACIKCLDFQEVNEFNQFLKAAGQPKLTDAEEQKYFPHSKTGPQPQHQSTTSPREAIQAPSEQSATKSPKPQENATDENLDIIEENSPAIPIINIPINHPRKFFGRKKELNRIFGRWRHRPLHNVAIIGPRRSGKTSLLHCIKKIHRATSLREGQRQDWLPTDTQFVFVDFQAAGMCEQEPLLCYLLEELNIPVPEPCNLAHFTKVMRSELQQPTVILMDRIDVGLQSPQLDYQFWWAIRALVTNYTNGNLGLLVASPQPPTEVMPAGGDNQPSPFLNIIAEIVKLGPLTENESRELLEHTPQPFAEADVEWILENSGRWPALLQILCDVRLRALEEEEQGEGWKKEGLARIEPYQCEYRYKNEN